MPAGSMGFGADFSPQDEPQSQQPQQPPQSLLEMLQGAGGDAGSLIAPPPQGWQSSTPAYREGGIGEGWIFGNLAENPQALAATKAGRQMPHGIDPFTDIVFNYMGNAGKEGGSSGFTLGSGMGPDLFGGRPLKGGNNTRDIPRELQPWLAPALMRYFYNQDYVSQGGSGMNAPWTGAYAPTAPGIGTWPYDAAYPGTTKYDPWHRPVGQYQNLYS